MKVTKQGLDYFPVDVNFLSDYSVQVLMDECGLHSFPVLMELMGRIYREEGYYLFVDDKLIFVVAKFFSLPKEEVQTMINKAVECGLFDQTMYEKYQILTSVSIQQQFIHACKRRKASEMITEYLLEEEKCIQKTTSTPDDACKSEHSNSNSNSNSESKKEKKEKEKENFGGDGGGDNAIPRASDETPPPPPPPTPAEGWKDNFKIYINDLKQAYYSLLDDKFYLQQKQKFYPKLDIHLTLEKIVSDYWATPAGWECQRKKDKNKIDWRYVFDKQFNYSHNHVKK